MDIQNGQGQNLRTHGAYSKVALLPDESEQDYTQLLDGLKDEWNPEGPSEQQEVKGLADGYWTLGRLDRFWAAKLSSLAAQGQLKRADRDRKDEGEKLRALLEKIPLTKNHDELNALLDQAGGSFVSMKLADGPDHRLVIKTTEQLIKDYENMAAAQADIASLAELGFDSDVIDQQLRSYERVHAKTARHLKMLLQIKTVKPILFRRPEGQRSAQMALVSPK